MQLGNKRLGWLWEKGRRLWPLMETDTQISYQGKLFGTRKENPAVIHILPDAAESFLNCDSVTVAQENQL